MYEQSADWDKVRAGLLKQPQFSKPMLAIMPVRDPPHIFSSVCEGIYPIRGTTVTPEGSNKNGYYRS